MDDSARDAESCAAVTSVVCILGAAAVFVLTDGDRVGLQLIVSVAVCPWALLLTYRRLVA